MDIEKALRVSGIVIIVGGILLSFLFLAINLEKNAELKEEFSYYYDSAEYEEEIGIFTTTTMMVYFFVSVFSCWVFGLFLMGLAKLIENQEKLYDLTKEANKPKKQIEQ